jgi:hypothetical protein
MSRPKKTPNSLEDADSGVTRIDEFVLRLDAVKHADRRILNQKSIFRAEKPQKHSPSHAE